MGTINSFANALGVIPSEIVIAIEKEYLELSARFSRHDWAPGELNSGRFAEAILRYLECKDSGGSFTPIGQELKRQAIINRVSNNPNLPEGLRFHVLKCTELLLDIRNKRDIAHLGSVIDVKEMDSRLVLRLAKWVLSEIIRVEASLDPKDIQVIIDKLTVQETPLIDEIDGDLIFVGTHLAMEERVLVTLNRSYPKPIELKTLRQIVKYRNSTRFRDEIIKKLIDEGKTHLKEEDVFITSKGIAWLEKYVNPQMEI